MCGTSGACSTAHEPARKRSQLCRRERDVLAPVAIHSWGRGKGKEGQNGRRSATRNSPFRESPTTIYAMDIHLLKYIVLNG